MKTQIRSAKQALKESQALKSYWSNESILTQRILIYIAELLEARKPARIQKRKLSKWQFYLRTALRNGKSIQQAAAEWKKK